MLRRAGRLSQGLRRSSGWARFAELKAGTPLEKVRVHAPESAFWSSVLLSHYVDQRRYDVPQQLVEKVLSESRDNPVLEQYVWHLVLLREYAKAMAIVDKWDQPPQRFLSTFLSRSVCDSQLDIVEKLWFHYVLKKRALFVDTGTLRRISLLARDNFHWCRSVFEYSRLRGDDPVVRFAYAQAMYCRYNSFDDFLKILLEGNSVPSFTDFSAHISCDYAVLENTLSTEWNGFLLALVCNGKSHDQCLTILERIITERGSEWLGKELLNVVLRSCSTRYECEQIALKFGHLDPAFVQRQTVQRIAQLSL